MILNKKKKKTGYLPYPFIRDKAMFTNMNFQILATIYFTYFRHISETDTTHNIIKTIPIDCWPMKQHCCSENFRLSDVCVTQCFSICEHYILPYIRMQKMFPLNTIFSSEILSTLAYINISLIDWYTLLVTNNILKGC